jgi:tetratricopeptide (TPR) repeat protein
MEKLHHAITHAFEMLADPARRAECLGQHPVEAADDHTASGERPVPPEALEALEPSEQRAPRRARRLVRTLPSVEAEPEGTAGERTTPPSGRRTVDNLTPSQLHERALVAMSEQRLTEALRLCLLACEASPDNPDYIASSIWIRACVPKPDLKVLTLDLDDLLLHHEDHVQARYYRGVLRRRLGYDSAAKQDFERVLSLAPDHAGARQHLEELGRANRSNG